MLFGWPQQPQLFSSPSPSKRLLHCCQANAHHAASRSQPSNDPGGEADYEAAADTAPLAQSATLERTAKTSRHGRPKRPKELLFRIQRSPNAALTCQLLRENLAAINAIHVSAACSSCVSQLKRGELEGSRLVAVQHFWAWLLRAPRWGPKEIASMGPRELSTLAWGMAHLGVPVSSGVHQALLDTAAAHSEAGAITALDAQLLLWALAHGPDASKELDMEAVSEEAAGNGAGQATALPQHRAVPVAAQQVAPAAEDAACSSPAGAAPAAGAICTWAVHTSLAAGGVTQAWLDCFLSGLLRVLPYCKSRTLAAMMHSLALLPGVLPFGQFVASAMDAAEGRMHTFAATDLSMLLWALSQIHIQSKQQQQQQPRQQREEDEQGGTQQQQQGHEHQTQPAPYCPSQQWVEQWLRAAAPKLQSMDSCELTAAMSALSGLGCVPPRRWLALVHGQLFWTGDQFTPRQVAVLLRSFAALRCQLPGEVMERLLLCRPLEGAPANNQSMSTTAGLLAGVAALKYAPEPEWMDAQHTALLQQLPHATAADLARATWALGTLKYMPRVEGLMEALMEAAEKLCGSCSGPQLASVMWGLGRLRVRPSRPWLGAMLRAAHVLLGSGCDERSLVMLLEGCAAMRCVPPRPWMVRALAVAAALVPRMSAGGVARLAGALAALRVCPEAALVKGLRARMEGHELARGGRLPLQLLQGFEASVQTLNALAMQAGQQGS